MDILTLHKLPAKNNARRKWLRELAPGDRVFSCSYTDYVDDAGYGKGEFEEGYVTTRSKDELVVCFDDDTTLRYAAATGQWIDEEGDIQSDEAWIIPAEGDTARLLRRILHTAQLIAPTDPQQRAHIISQLRRTLSGVNGEGTQAAAERVLAQTLQLRADMKHITGSTFYNEDGIDALVAGH